MKIGIFGGSFNPIHNGHIALGECMLQAMQLDEVWYLVSPQNPLKQSATDLIDESDRLHLVQLALQDRQGLCASDFEFSLPRPSYTWDTLQALHRSFPNNEFTLIIGGDNWVHFDKWAHHDEIVATHRIAIFPREDCHIDETTLPQNVHLVHVPLVNVTSTMLRCMIQNGEDIHPYVPAVVADEIVRRRLYPIMVSQSKPHSR